MLAGKIPDQRESVVRLVLVRGCLGAGADDIYAEDGEAYDDGGEAEECGVPKGFPGFQRAEEPPEAEGEDRHQEEGGAGVVGQPQHVHEEEVDVCGGLGEPGDDDEHQQPENDSADDEDLEEFLEGEGAVFALAVVEHEHQRRDGQEVKEVDADAEAHQEGDEHYPAVGMRLVGNAVPFSHDPEDERGHQRTHGVDFAFDGGEPEGV